MIATAPTVGSNVEEVVFRNMRFLMWDLGGQDVCRETWQAYYPNTEVVPSTILLAPFVKYFCFYFFPDSFVVLSGCDLCDRQHRQREGSHLIEGVQRHVGTPCTCFHDPSQSMMTLSLFLSLSHSFSFSLSLSLPLSLPRICSGQLSSFLPTSKISPPR